MNVNFQPKPTNYHEALHLLAGKSALKIANNTYLEGDIYHDSVGEPVRVVTIRLHATVIVAFFPNGITMLNSGGYLTNTTKERLNRYIPEGSTIAQRDGKWRYFAADIKNPVNQFVDGMKIDSVSGEVQ